ncbi:carbohydrate ABC transporter permease [Haloarcula amylovorans]|uniref:carbohydrate ABC transporter permease n=1 Tax=Haloarcula amylovorans TaxID=2562280 RepID=UPI001076A9E4|nr:sugar ABC transporter permease [Halomicroarcula amylolytica]
MSFSNHIEKSRVIGRKVSEEIDWSLALVLPGLFLFTAFMLFPMLYLLYLSITNATPATVFQGEEIIVGLENYIRVLTDPQFWNSFGITWLWVFTSVILKMIFAVGIAIVVTSRGVLGKRWFQALLILPYGFPPIFRVVIFRGIFSTARFGLANQFLLWLGFEPVAWLSRRWMAFISYNITEVWLSYPFLLLIIIGALQGVPDSLVDAAKVDGAGPAHRFINVTLPAIKRPVLFATILTSAASFQNFIIPFVFNGGGPSRTNELIILYGYKEAFNYGAYGQGSAIMVIALVFIGLFMIINVKKGKLADKEKGA